MSQTLHAHHRQATQEEPRILALHCSGSSGRQWASYAARWVGRFDAPDLLGYGAQPWPTGRSLTLDEEAEHVAGWIGAEPVHLVGHSYGGAVALQLALRHPGRIAALTLFEPVRFHLLRSDADSTAWDEIVRLARRVCTLARAGFAAAAAARFADYWSGAGTWKAMSASRQLALAQRMPKIAAEFQAIFSDTAPLSAYGALRMPVRLVVGTASPLPARRVAHRLQGLLPHARHIDLAGIGHMGPLTHADAFAALLPQRNAPAPLALAA
ncbi:alpha/beta fold hydrolase [Ramlibacter rhizophilus]|uniref:Alpha/beta fold hydrolase n=1 Tax=Ramlibacter rhizophilus TaxID=1781167 RepID=A0A4Z0BKS2_9BURK|nr:alpha/beta fold hydrolase [Ramlibacter rhizophilus]TFY98498.1 alpha/beta fold hydrolase [Ramlibacter rhizophilus]